MTTYLGLFLAALSALALEITLVRLLSVATWYHLAFFAISTAMLGMTAGAVTVYLRARAYEPERLPRALGGACLLYALSIPFSLSLLCILPLGMRLSVMSLAALGFCTAACALPFYF